MNLELFYGAFLQDESLFGPPARLKQMTGNRSWTDTTVPDTSSKEKSKNGEKMLLITKDLIRKLKYEYHS